MLSVYMLICKMALECLHLIFYLLGLVAILLDYLGSKPSLTNMKESDRLSDWTELNWTNMKAASADGICFKHFLCVVRLNPHNSPPECWQGWILPEPCAPGKEQSHLPSFLCFGRLLTARATLLRLLYTMYKCALVHRWESQAYPLHSHSFPHKWLNWNARHLWSPRTKYLLTKLCLSFCPSTNLSLSQQMAPPENRLASG